MSDGASEQPQISTGMRRYTLFMLVVIYTSSFIDRSIINILVEPIKHEFGASDAEMGLLTGFYFALFYATLGMPVAKWADRSNRRNIITLAVTIWSATTALCGYAQNFAQLAAARIGVGIGEAGSSPPSHSMIADMYKREERVSAMAIYSLGIHIGIMLGFFIGGWIAETYGWRAAFLVVGFPGLVIAVIFRFTVPEPARGQLKEGASSSTKAAELTGLRETFVHLWRTPSLRHVVIGSTLVSFIGYGGVAFGAAFLMRSHGLGIAEVGTILAPLGGLMGIIGALSAGKIADKLALKDARWTAWVVAVAKTAAIPLALVFYLTDNLILAFIAYAPMVALSASYQGSTFSMVQTLTPLKVRTQASAILLFIINFIGLGGGPLTVGYLSDVLNPEYGADSLRYALLAVSMLGLWGAYHYYQAGRHYRDDLEKSGILSEAPATA